jgi:hypothetical protein
MNFLHIVFLIIFSICNVTCNSAIADTNNITEIYTDGTGNNKYEAKIKAIDSGMRRALMIVADKFGVPDSGLEKATYEELKTAFKQLSIRNEKWAAASKADVSYSATIGYSYKQSAVNSLILQYGSQATKDKFFECAVIPIFKVHKLFFINDNKKDWIKAWSGHESEMKERNIYLAKLNRKNASAVGTKFATLDYDMLLNMLDFKIYKFALMAVVEYFTNKDGSSYLELRTTNINVDSKHEDVVKFPMPDHKKDVIALHEKIISTIINKYGRVTADTKSVSSKSEISQLLAENDKSISDLEPIVMAVEAYNPSDIKKIKDKLLAIPTIKKCVIISDDNGHFFAKIYTEKSLEELTEDFYLHSLSYYQNNDYMVLIEK